MPISRNQSKTASRYAPESRKQRSEKPHGPFAHCQNCPYVAHGFLCYSKHGSCLKTNMEIINQRRTHQ